MIIYLFRTLFWPSFDILAIDDDAVVPFALDSWLPLTLSWVKLQKRKTVPGTTVLYYCRTTVLQWHKTPWIVCSLDVWWHHDRQSVGLIPWTAAVVSTILLYCCTTVVATVAYNWGMSLQYNYPTTVSRKFFDIIDVPSRYSISGARHAQNYRISKDHIDIELCCTGKRWPPEQ